MISIRTMISESKIWTLLWAVKSDPVTLLCATRVVLNSSSQFAFAASPKKLRV